MEAGAGMPPPSPEMQAAARASVAPGSGPLDPPPPIPAHASVPPPPVVHNDVPPPPPPTEPANNVLPFPVPPAPPVPTATAPAVSTTIPPSAPAFVASFDKSGVPYDVRIHQRGRAQKKDGTWKIQKNLDPAVVESVMRELAQRVNAAEGLRQWQLAQAGEAPAPTAPAAPNAPPTAGASAPVSLPPPPPPVNPQAVPNIPPPPATVAEGQALDQTPGAQGPGADPFRALITKITHARTTGKLTSEEVTQAWTNAGAPSLQLLNAMPHLIPAVDTYIDACIASR